MRNELLTLYSAELVDEDVELTLAELCQICHLSQERLLELVEQGVIEPRGHEPAHWRFHAISVRRIHCAQRLERDLGVNVAGAALALELLEELEQLRNRLRRLE